MESRGGLIICGGQSRRMGQPKAWLPFGRERLLQRVVRLVAMATDVVVVVAAPGQDLPDLPGSVRVVRDLVADQGPLWGLANGLSALPEAVDLVYASSTDVPFLQPAWIERLVALIGDDDLVIPDIGGHLHPLAALYRREPVLGAARKLMGTGERRLVALRDAVRSRTAGAASLADVDPSFATLRNLNTPDDYRQALHDAGFAADKASESA